MVHLHIVRWCTVYTYCRTMHSAYNVKAIFITMWMLVLKITWHVLIDVTAMKFVFVCQLRGLIGLYQRFLTYMEGKPNKKRNGDIKPQMRWSLLFLKFVRSDFLSSMKQKQFKCRHHSIRLLNNLRQICLHLSKSSYHYSVYFFPNRWKQLTFRKTSFQPASTSTYMSHRCSVTSDTHFFWSRYKQSLTTKLLDCQ